jgi:hypothetical protein
LGKGQIPGVVLFGQIVQEIHRDRWDNGEEVKEEDASSLGEIAKAGCLFIQNPAPQMKQIKFSTLKPC